MMKDDEIHSAEGLININESWLINGVETLKKGWVMKSESF